MTIRESRRASRSSCSANRATASGSSAAASRSVSAAAWIDAAGVFSSWEAFATKSRRTASSRRDSVTSVTTTRTDPSSAAGVATTRSHRVGVPSSTSTDRVVRSSGPPGSPVGRRPGRSARAPSGRAPRWRWSASFAKAVRMVDRRGGARPPASWRGSGPGRADPPERCARADRGACRATRSSSFARRASCACARRPKATPHASPASASPAPTTMAAGSIAEV